jgi:hypothetical protein
MISTLLYWIAGILVTVVISGGLYQIVGDVGLAAVTGIVWGIWLLMMVRIAHQYPSHMTGDSWSDKRWTGLSTGLLTLAVLVVISPTLPISFDLRIGLGSLVMGAGLVGYNSGTMAELERNTE